MKKFAIYFSKRIWLFLIPLLIAISISTIIFFASSTISIFYTALIAPTYQSSSSMLIITDEGTTIQDFSAGQQIINNSPAVIKENVFCEKVANLLTNNSPENENGKIDTYKELLNSNATLVKELGGNQAYDFNIYAYTNGNAITASYISSTLTVKVSSDAQNTFTVTATTTNPKLSAIIATAVTTVYEEYVKEEIVTKGTEISTNIYQNATVPQKASNKNYISNFEYSLIPTILISAIIFSSAVLLDVFILILLIVFFRKKESNITINQR